MPIPITSLDDRSFDDLANEARARLARHLPEMTQLSEGDPIYALVDVFAWMTESLIYRANLIPLRQRQAFLNLLQLPLRPAVPARGIVCVDAKAVAGSQLPGLLATEAKFNAAKLSFTSQGEVQPLPLAMAVMIKERFDMDQLSHLGISKASLRELYNTEVEPFRPRTLTPGVDSLNLAESFDQHFYLCVYLPDKKQVPHADALRRELAGKTLNVGLAPEDELAVERAEELAPRRLNWDIGWQKTPGAKRATYLPLEQVDDSSDGGRKIGVARLRLPKSEAALKADFSVDPQYAGFDNTPPEPPSHVEPEQVLFWLRLSAPEDGAIRLGYLGINAVEVIGQEVVRDQMVGVGNGRPAQIYSVQRPDVDSASVDIQVSEHGSFVSWRQVEHFASSGPDDRVFRFDSASGSVQFGDGLRGKRPPAQSRIRAAYYRCGGGSASNLAADTIKQLASGNSSLSVRHEWPTKGGRDAETVAQAEQRIPAHLNHRNRAVTKDDFAELAKANPINPVGRAEVVPGLLPGTSLGSVRSDIPGVISVFVLPPQAPVIAGAPRPSAALLRDVYHYLEQRKLLGTELYVLSPQFVPLAISVAVQVLDPSTETQTLKAVTHALLTYLWALAPGGPAAEGWPMGRKVQINELQAVVARVSGVLSVGPLRLFSEDLQQQRWQEIQQLPLQPYQLPEVMAASAHNSEDSPPPPDLVSRSNGDDGGDGGASGAAVPVIPDVC